MMLTRTMDDQTTTIQIATIRRRSDLCRNERERFFLGFDAQADGEGGSWMVWMTFHGYATTMFTLLLLSTQGPWRRGLSAG